MPHPLLLNAPHRRNLPNTLWLTSFDSWGRPFRGTYGWSRIAQESPRSHRWRAWYSSTQRTASHQAKPMKQYVYGEGRGEIHLKHCYVVLWEMDGKKNGMVQKKKTSILQEQNPPSHMSLGQQAADPQIILSRVCDTSRGSVANCRPQRNDQLWI